MISIRMMAKVGPWELRVIEKLDDWNRCERCSTRLKEHWVMALQSGEPFEGRVEWRIGNQCGPQLKDISEEQWKRFRGANRRFLLLLLDVMTVIEFEKDHPEEVIDSKRGRFEDHAQAVIQGQLDGARYKTVRRHATLAMKRYRLGKYAPRLGKSAPNWREVEVPDNELPEDEPSE